MEQPVMAEPAVPAPAPSGLSIRGLWEVFYQPAEFFKQIKDHPRVLLVYLLVVAATAVAVYLLSDFLAQMQIDAIRQRPNMPAEAVPTVEQIKPWMMIGVVFFSFLPLITAALAMFWGNFIFGGKASFKQLLSVHLYGLWVFSIGGLIQSGMALAKGSLKASLSLATLVPNEPVDSLLYVALSKISVFHVWELIAVGIGLSIVYGFSRNKGYLLAVLSVGIMSIIHIITTAIGKAFS